MLSEFTKYKLDELFDNWFEYYNKYCFGEYLDIKNSIYLEIVNNLLFDDEEKRYMKNKLGDL